MKTFKRRNPISAIELRCTAGCAPERRGSALLIVIGTLALVAVFAAVYVSIGRTDRRAANALRTRIEQRDTSIQLSEYFAGVIGDDRLDMYVQYDFNGNAFMAREVTDAPYTDWTRRSEANLGNSAQEALLFTPSGRPFRPDGLTPLNDFRVANDPWLASTTPTFLGFPGNPIDGFDDQRPFGSIQPSTQNYPNATNYLDQRDWLQISNFAPDGRFVNLFNLRPNLPQGFSGFGGAGSAVGGFDAEPGIGTSPRADGRPIRRMGNFLSLLDQENPGQWDSLVQAFDPADRNAVWVPGYNLPQDVGLVGDEYYNTPAVWTMYQRFMFMPINQQFVIKNRIGNESTWADPDYPLYQYADANGDGFADSRWIELTSARDNQSSGQNRDDIEQLFEQGDMRYFIAARAVDLSSMVNVNTATDSLVIPTIDHPHGLTPAELDLRRLLTMQDPAGDFTSILSGSGVSSNGVPLSYSAIPRPYTAAVDQAEPRSWAAPARPNDFRRDESDYNFYQSTTRVSGDIRIPDSNSPSYLIGRYAYDALQRAKGMGGSLTKQYRGVDLQTGGSITRFTDLVQYPAVIGGSNPIPDRITAKDRYDEYMAGGRQYTVNPGLANIRGQVFGLDDLSELLTYHGLNDPDFTSRLERVMEGRYESHTGDTLQTRRLNPFLSNRDLTLDRMSHGRILESNDMRDAPSLDNRTDLSRIGEVSRNSMALMALTPRKRVSTITGFVPLSPDTRFGGAGISANDLPTFLGLDAGDVLPTLSSVVVNQNELFGIYSSSLGVGIKDLQGLSNWEIDPAQFASNSYASLFYAHRGPELGLRIAAHASLNMADLADSNQDTSVATLLLDSQLRNDLTDTNNFDEPLTDADYQLYPGAANGTLFDVDPDGVPGGPESLLPSSHLNDARRVVNVYGVEAMPVITEVSTMYIYHDAPGLRLSGPGDEDYDTSIEPRADGSSEVTYPAPGVAPRITIDGVRDTSNGDYLGQVLAFQLHNPYGEPISLGGSGIDVNAPLTRQREWNDQALIDDDSNFQFSYYIEFAGRFYKLAQYIEWYPTDQNADNFYAIDDPASNPAYGDVPNPQVTIPMGNGGRMEPGTDTSASAVAGDYTSRPQAPYSDFITRNVVLQPGETRVFYVLAEKRFDDDSPFTLDDGDNPDDKWTRLLSLYGDLHTNFGPTGRDIDFDLLPDGAFGDTRGWTGPAEQFFEKHLHVRGNSRTPVMMMEFDPRDGKLLNESLAGTAVDDPAAPAPAASVLFANRNDETEVRLWKKVTTIGEETDEQDTSNANVNPTYRNIVQNDLLVDRLSLTPTITTLAMEMNLTNQEVDNSVSYREDFPRRINGLPIRNDNYGITVVNWKSIRRVDSESALQEDEPQPGEITPWMLRSTTNPDLAPIEHTPLDLVDGLVLDGTEVVDSNSARLPETPITEYFETHRTLRELVDTASFINGEEIIQTLSLEPHYKSEPVQGAGVIEDDSGNDTAMKFVPRWPAISGTAIENRSAVLFTGGSAPINERPRLADLLLTTGIGPSFSPLPTRTASSTEYIDTEWQTMPEALASVLGFDDLASVPDDEARSIWRNAWDNTIGEGILDDAHLALDRFVPFVNTDLVTPIEFDTNVDNLRGSGVPMALGVLDRARAIERQARSTDPIDSAAFETQLDLTRAIFGTININTAPVEVLRLLPGLTPSRAEYVDESGAVVKEWWGSDQLYSNLNVPDMTTAGTGTYEILRENPDIAAAIVSYRDRIYGVPNTAARPESHGIGIYSNAPLYLSTEVTNLDTVATNMIGEIPLLMDPAQGNFSIDRETFTGIDGLRTTPGFGSVGELFAVRVDPEFNGGGNNPLRWLSLRHLSIDQLGFDERAQGVANGPDDQFTIVPQVFNNNAVGSTVDDYAEKLAIANGVLNMISVRSDYYAVWFVVQGFKESDVANLRPEDPLIPSLHKRYLMVIDRSNVVEVGDQPKIVLLKEVPL